MTADLTVRFHDAARRPEPPEWADYHRRDAHHPLWSWPVVRALTDAYGDPVIAATLHDAGEVVGAVVGRVRAIGPRRRPALSVADLNCPGSTAQPGIRLIGGAPGVRMTSTDVARYAAAVDAIESALRHEWPARIDLVWHRQAYAEVLPAVQRGLCFVYPGNPSAMLRRGFDSWDAYLATLGRSRRSSVRRVVRQFEADQNLTIATTQGRGHAAAAEPAAESGGDDLDTAFALMRTTAERHHTRRFPPMPFWPPQLLRALFAEPSAATLRYRDSTGRLLAAGVLFEHPDVPVHGHWGALDREHGAPSGLWIDQMARTVRRNVEAGARGVVGGKGLTELKAEFGFDVVPQWSVVRRLPGRRASGVAPAAAAATTPAAPR